MKNVKGIVYTAMLSTLALVLGLIQIPTPFAPWLAIDGSEIIVLVAGNFFGFGVMTTVIILRSVLRWALGISTGFFIVGEIAAILSSLMLGGIFLLIKKRCLKPKNDENCELKNTFKINNILAIVITILLIPFTYFAFQSEEKGCLILGSITLFLPILIYFIFTLIKKEKSIKFSGQILTATSAIFINSVIMTFLNFFVITPSNFLQKPAIFSTILAETHMPMNAYVIGYILPVLPFNILNGIISVIVYFLIEKTLTKVFKTHNVHA